MQVMWRMYHIVAATLRRGSNVECGHYQALLFHAGQTWLVDDGTRPRPHQVTPCDAKDVHLLWVVPEGPQVQRHKPCPTQHSTRSHSQLADMIASMCSDTA